MPEKKHQKDEDMVLRQIRAEFWTKRLDHTLTHTQTSSRLIYIIDGAVLALVYFSFQEFGAIRPIVLIAAVPTFVLFVLNLLHARLITIQRSWYSGIEQKLIDLLKVEKVDHTKKLCVLGSTHGIYRTMHLVIAAVLLIGALTMLFYGLGFFPDLIPKAKVGG